MDILFLPSAGRDLRWFREYYTGVFPDGHDRASRQLRAILRILRANPYIGRETEAGGRVRELIVPRTPFILLYRVDKRESRIEILRVIDGRSGWKE